MQLNDLEHPPRPSFRKIRSHLKHALSLINKESRGIERYFSATRSMADLARRTSKWDRLQVTPRSIEESIRDISGRGGRPSVRRRFNIALTLGVALRVHGLPVGPSRLGTFWGVLQEVLPAYGYGVTTAAFDDMAACARYVKDRTSAQCRDKFYLRSAPWVGRLSRAPGDK